MDRLEIGYLIGLIRVGTAYRQESFDVFTNLFSLCINILNWSHQCYISLQRVKRLKDNKYNSKSFDLQTPFEFFKWW